MVTQIGFLCNHLRQLSPRVQRPDALSPRVIYYLCTQPPQVPTVGTHSTGCAEPCSLAVLVLHPGQQGRRYFRWTGHATSQDAASALTYHRILRCNSRCPQGPQLTEPRILAPMGGSHRCDRPAASLSTVRKGRPPLGAQTLIPQLQGLATRASSSQPSTMGALSLQVAQHRCHVVAPVSPELNSAPPTSGYVGRLREPLALAGLLSSQKGIARPASHCTLPVQTTWAICVQRPMQQLVGSRNQQGGAPGCTILSQTGS